MTKSACHTMARLWLFKQSYLPLAHQTQSPPAISISDKGIPNSSQCVHAQQAAENQWLKTSHHNCPGAAPPYSLLHAVPLCPTPPPPRPTPISAVSSCIANHSTHASSCKVANLRCDTTGLVSWHTAFPANFQPDICVDSSAIQANTSQCEHVFPWVQER